MRSPRRAPGAGRHNKGHRRMKPVILTAAALAALAFAAPARADGDAAAGKSVFAKCAICHTTDPAKKGIGPTLFGVVGRKAGALEGFAFSDSMKSANRTWDEATLDTYLTDPRKEYLLTSSFGGAVGIGPDLAMRGKFDSGILS